MLSFVITHIVQPLPCVKQVELANAVELANSVRPAGFKSVSVAVEL